MEVGNMLKDLLDEQKELQSVRDQINVLLDRQEKLYKRQSKQQSKRLSQLKSLLEARKDVGSPVKDGASTSREDLSGTFDWEIINAIMSRRNVLVFMAAGCGKSLCYQLPAILQEGAALVVSPLPSLIQDQVKGLAALGIPAHMLTSKTGKGNNKFIYNALGSGGELKILYVTPEMISESKTFMSKLEKCHRAGRLSLIAIDAHCFSQWGDDFQLDYEKLAILKKKPFSSVPVVVLTATATWKVRNDVMEMLQIPNCVKFVSTPNLYYMVREKSSKAEVVVDEIAEFIRTSYPKNESGIVYCFTWKKCEWVAEKLRDRRISAGHYHARMDENARKEVHSKWSDGELQVIIGTMAFGVGTNKPDVRFVIHHSLSKSMETYYQESGRAGRDGCLSKCLLYYRAADVHRLSSKVLDKNSELQNLYEIVRYCQSKRQCRRSAFFEDVAEAAPDCNGRCDNCAFSNEIKEVDVSGHAKLVIIMLQHVQKDQTLTMLQLVDKLKTMQKELGSDLKKEQLKQLVIQLILDQVLKEEYQHTAYATNAYVTLGPLRKKVLLGKMKITIGVLSIQERMNDNIKYTKRSLTTSALQFKLDDRRKKLSICRGISPQSVLSAKEIDSICDKNPSTMEELESIIGKRKAKKYGRTILEAVRSTKSLIS